MTEFKVDTIVDLAGTGKPNFTTGVTMNGAAPSTLNLGEYTASSTEPSSPKNGSIWWDTTNEKIFIYIDGEFKETIGIAGAVWYGDRGLFFGGDSSGGANTTNVIDYVTIATSGNATDFGDMVSNSYYPAATSNGTRAIVTAGFTGSASNDLLYVTTATTGNAAFFGDLTTTTYNGGACSDGSRGIRWAGESTNTIDYVTIETTGNSTDFGDDVANINGGRATSDATYGFRAGGTSGSATGRNDIAYITIQTAGNAADFGDLLGDNQTGGLCSDPTRAVYFGGYPNATTNVIQYWTTGTTSGNASDFGDLSSASRHQGASANGTKAVVALGSTGNISSPVNTIDQVTIQTTANSTDFGDLTQSRYGPAAASGSAS